MQKNAYKCNNDEVDVSNFRNIEEIPLNYRDIFAGYPCFNLVQSKVLDDVLYTDNSVVVSAPTGSGKTAIFELAIVRFLTTFQNARGFQQFKIIYISPVKALCQERLIDWHKKFANYGLNCISVTGDTDNADLASLLNHNLIITTPEKWDSLTRKWRDNKKIVQVVKLFMIDEVHLLNEDNRGSTLEVIVSRMKTIENSLSCQDGDTNSKIRFLALSATIGNIEDVADWINHQSNTKHYKFSENVRPVPLKKIVLGYTYNAKSSTPFKFDIMLSYKLQNLMIQYSAGKPTLIFCSTRKSVEMTAKHIFQNLTINLSLECKQKLVNATKLITDTKVKEILIHGVAYHHAGLIPETRHSIEDLFRNGDLPVLVTTSTLAMGVNLPAHLVIIKSTKCYSNAGFEDYSETAILQMIGRAGRPQFDTSAVALILTTTNDKGKFERMIEGTQPIESNLHRHLVEHLNAEVALRTITDLDVALQWLALTFLYIRARKNPRLYGLPMGLSTEQIDKKLLEMCQIEMNKLVRAGMITIDQNIVISSTETGIAMAKYCIAFETMKLFTKITGNEILQQILGLISKCYEFSEMCLRVDDKKCLNMLNKKSNKQSIRFPLNGKIKTLDMKINCIIQAVFGCLEIYDHGILADSYKIMRNGERITKCLVEYLQTRPDCYSALLNTIVLAKCFHTKIWEKSAYVSKQLTGIGNVASSQLVNAGKTSFSLILQSNPRDLEMIIKKKAPTGDRIIEEVRCLPRYDVKMEIRKVGDKSDLYLRIFLMNVDDLQQKLTANQNSIMCLLVGDNLNRVLLHERYTHSYMLETVEVEKFVDLQGKPDLELIEAHFLSEDWVGFDCYCKLGLSGDENVMPSNPIKEKSAREGPTYIQMFMDMYMKIRKNVSGKSKKLTQPKTQSKSNAIAIEEAAVANVSAAAAEERVASEISNIEEEKEIVEQEISNEENPEESLNDEAFNEGVEGICKNNLKFMEDKTLSKDFSLKPEETVNDKIRDDAFDMQKEEPFLFSLTQKYAESSSKDNLSNVGKKELKAVKRKIDTIHSGLTFEDSLYQEHQQHVVDVDQYRFAGRKKLSHSLVDKENVPDSTVAGDFSMFSGRTRKKTKFNVDDNAQKSIKWRSPLVYSPPIKFSPKMDLQNTSFSIPDIEIEPVNETFETSTTSSNHCATVSSLKTTPRNARLKNNWPLMKLRTSQPGTKFPLCDKDCDDSPRNATNKDDKFDEAMDKFSDICSNSFLENVGLRTSENCTASAGEYYSRLLSRSVSEDAKNKSTFDELAAFREKHNEREERFQYNFASQKFMESTLNQADFRQLEATSEDFRQPLLESKAQDESGPRSYVPDNFGNNSDHSSDSWNENLVKVCSQAMRDSQESALAHAGCSQDTFHRAVGVYGTQTYDPPVGSSRSYDTESVRTPFESNRTEPSYYPHLVHERRHHAGGSQRSFNNNYMNHSRFFAPETNESISNYNNFERFSPEIDAASPGCSYVTKWESRNPAPSCSCTESRSNIYQGSEIVEARQLNGMFHQNPCHVYERTVPKQWNSSRSASYHKNGVRCGSQICFPRGLGLDGFAGTGYDYAKPTPMRGHTVQKTNDTRRFLDCVPDYSSYNHNENRFSMHINGLSPPHMGGSHYNSSQMGSYGHRSSNFGQYAVYHNNDKDYIMEKYFNSLNELVDDN